MSTGKYLGKISAIRIGSGGYQDAMFGISFELSFDGSSGIGDFWGAWGAGIKNTASCKWAESDRQEQLADAFWRLAKLMQEAKVNDFTKLAGVPVEVEIEGNTLKSWRVLTEVL